MDNVESARTINIRSRAMVGEKPLWEGRLVVGLLNSGNQTSGAVPYRSAAMRVLAQTTNSATMVVKSGAGEKGEYADYHSPMMLHAAVRPHGGEDDGSGNSLIFAGQEPELIYNPVDKGDGKLPFNDVTLLAPNDLLTKHSSQIQIPLLTLDSGEIPVLVPASMLQVKPQSDGVGFIFGKDSQMKVGIRKVNNKDHVAVTLTPEGVSFIAVVTNPFPYITGKKEFELRMLLSYDNAKKPEDGPVGCTVRPIGGKDASDFRRAFDELISKFDRFRALQLLVAPGPAPLAWNLGKTLSVKSDTDIVIDTNAIEATLLTQLTAESDFPRTCRITAGRASLTRGTAGRLIVQSAKVSDTPEVTLRWEERDSIQPTVTFGQPSGKTERISGVIETEALRETLMTRYMAAGVLPPDFEAETSTYAFLPLERGVLQLPLPPPQHGRDKKVPKPAASAFTGSITVRKPLGPAELQSHLPSAFSATVQLVAAARAVITLSFSAAGKPQITAEFDGVIGKVAGLIFASGGSPSADEIVPTLEAGPVATEALEIVVGNADAVGWSVECQIASVGKHVLLTKILGPSGPTKGQITPVVAWLAHSRMALVSSMPMTRTRNNPSKPSQSRDLVPHFHDVQINAAKQWTKPLTLEINLTDVAAGRSSLPALKGLSPREPRAGEPAWPWPLLEEDLPALQPTGEALDRAELSDGLDAVSLASLTLPGVEFGGNGEAVFSFSGLRGSLRFDLPLLGELHASAATPQKPTGEQGNLAANSDPAPTALDLARLDTFWRRGATRLALTRTMNDCVTRWHAIGNPAIVSITGLLEPYVWKPTFRIDLAIDQASDAIDQASDLPLGSYRLDTELAHGSTALAGLTARFKVEGATLKLDNNAGPVSVVGFALGLQNQDENAAGGGTRWQFDTRGIGHDRRPTNASNIEIRRMAERKWSSEATPPRVEAWWAVTAPDLHFEHAGMKLGLRFRDMPFEGTENKLVFGGDGGVSGGIEGLVSPDGRIFRREHLGRAVYEWSFFQQREDKPASFVIPFGPLRFRPLRLAKVQLDNDALTLLEVIGSFEPPRNGDEAPPGAPFVDDDPYASGNLAKLTFAIDKGMAKLQAVSGIAVKDRSAIVIKAGQSAEAKVAFHATADVLYGAARCSAAVNRRMPVEVEFVLEAVSGVLAAKDASGELSATIFGAARILAGGSVKISPDMKVVFTSAQSKPFVSGLSVRSITVAWKADRAEPEIVILAVLAISPGASTAPQRQLIEWELGKSLRWFGVRLDLAGAAHPFDVDHANGQLRLSVKGRAPSEGAEFLRHWPMPDAQLTLHLACRSESRAQPGGNHHGLWEPLMLVAGFAETLCEKASLTTIRHRMINTGASIRPAWQSRLLVTSADLALTTFSSAIEWPLDNLADDRLDPPHFQPASHRASDWSRKITISSAPRYRHKIRISLCDVELDDALLGTNKDYNKLVGAWTFPAVVDHSLVRGETEIHWTAVDEVVIGDLELFVVEAKKAVVSKPGGKDEVMSAGYAFVARYRDAVQALSKQSKSYAPSSGVFNNALARTGLPTWEMVNALFKHITAPPNPPNVPIGLFISGASVVDVATTLATMEAQAEGHTIVTPWLAQLGTGAAHASLGPLDLIPQAPASGTGTATVSTFDLAPQLPRKLDTRPPVRLPAGVASVALLARALDTQMREPKAKESSRLVDDYTPVSQAITASFEHKYDPNILPADYLKSPIWLRTIIAWKAVKDAYKDKTYLQSQNGDKLELADNISTMVLLTPRRGVVADRRVIRVIPMRITDNAVSDQQKVPQARKRFDLLVLSRDGLHTLELPDIDIDIDQPEAVSQLGPRLLQIALTATAAPLAVAVAEVVDPDPLVGADLRLHGSLDFIDLPRFLDEPSASRPLRLREQTLFGSPAMAWPRPAERLGIAHAAPHLGDQRPLQDADHAWAGDVRSLSVAARAWKADETFGKASVFAIGQKALFRRQKDEALMAPPDRAQIPVPPRARIPVPQSIEQALQSLRLKDNHGKLEGAISAIQPPHLEIVTTGRRPGVLFFQHDGLIFGDGDDRFDHAHHRFGRPGDRGPVVWRQMRAPRSTKFGEFWSYDKPQLDRRRRTFLAENFFQKPTPGDWKNAQLQPFVVARGPMLVLRHDDPITGSLIGVLLTPIDIVDGKHSGNAFVLDANWKGVLPLLASSHSTIQSNGTLTQIDLSAVLIAQGLLTTSARVTLVVGEQNFRFEKITYVSTGAVTGAAQSLLTLTLLKSELAGAQQALRMASGDVRTLLVVELNSEPHFHDAALDSKVVKEIVLNTKIADALVSGPPRILTMPMPVAPVDRPFLPITTATIAFGDPAYDREIASKTESARLRDKDGTILLAADRNEYDIGSSIQFACGRVASTDGSDPEWAADSQALDISISFGLIRKAAPDKQERLVLASVKAKPEQEPPYKPDYLAKSGNAYSIAIADFRTYNPVLYDVPPELAAGDRLVLKADFKDANDAQGSLSIDLTIVAEPVMAPPAASYGLVTRDKDVAVGERLTSSLFASAPLPQVVEFPDLLGDLAKGHVGRRGLFVWQFVPRSMPRDEDPFAALIKIDRTGGGQTPDSIADFLPPLNRNNE